MNPTLFPWMIAVPLGASPFVYLAGRLGYHKAELNGRSLLVRVLALLTMLSTWVLFALSWMKFSSQNEPLLFHLDSIWLHADGISFLLAAMVFSSEHSLFYFQVHTLRAKSVKKNTTPCCWSSLAP